MPTRFLKFAPPSVGLLPLSSGRPPLKGMSIGLKSMTPGDVMFVYLNNYTTMKSINFCFRRINPALSIDLCYVGIAGEKEFTPLTSDQFELLLRYLASIGLPDFIRKSDISQESYVLHGKVIDLLTAVKPDQIDWFQDTLILTVPFNLGYHESSKKEE